MNYSHDTNNTAPTRFAEVGASRLAYRRFGTPIGTPIVLLQHFTGDTKSAMTTSSTVVRRRGVGRELLHDATA